jgi:hypothetical protein
MSSETSCRIRKKNPTGMRRRAGQTLSPPALEDISSRTYAFTNTGQENLRIRMAMGKRKNIVLRMSDPDNRVFRQTAGNHVNSDVSIMQKRVTGAKKKNSGEPIPLQFQSHVEAGV